MLANIAIRTGRPVLTIPNADNIASIGKRVMVAWNDSREAARAAFDALPFMINAESVRVLAIDPQDGTGHDRVANGEELALLLARHGIKADAAAIRDVKRSVGEEIVARLEEEKRDLLIMGCYGHSRFRESVLGGVTRELLQRMPLPVLFSH